MVNYPASANDVYLHGEIYDVLDSFDELSSRLGMLARRGLIDQEELTINRYDLAQIRRRLEAHLPDIPAD